jgi:hypothetical protein
MIPPPTPAAVDSVTLARSRLVGLVELAEDQRLELADVRRFHQVERDSLDAFIAMAERFHVLEVDALRAQLPKWYDSPRLHFVAGFVLAALAVDQVARE